MRVAVPRETAPGERRVALVPETVSKLSAAGFEIRMEQGAGAAAGFPDDAFESARVHVPRILARQGVTDVESALAQRNFDRIPLMVTVVPPDLYADAEPEARSRLAGRDEDDWPYLALALTLDCPIWTEDTDFFGSGVATWTTDRVERYLSE